jgi:hypothetical protein
VRTLSRRFLISSRLQAASIAFLLCICCSSAARAGAPAASSRERGSAPGARGPREPSHYLAMLTAGAGLRLTRNDELGQRSLGPAFLDGFAAYLLSGRTGARHGPGLGFSSNLVADGGFAEPVAAGEQWTLVPSYLACWNPHPDLLLAAHLGPVFQVSGRSKSRGGEAALGAGYRILAGVGLYAESTISIFGGAYATLNPALSLEAGLFLDYEALP